MNTPAVDALCRCCGHASAFHTGGLGACTHPCPCRHFRSGRQAVPREVGRRRWALVDWGLPDATIAQRLKVTRAAVAWQRKKAPPPVSSRKWREVDWTLKPRVIAEMLGISRWAVYKQKKKRFDKTRTNT